MYEFKTEPFPHQDQLFEATKDLPFWGILWEQGCGKTKPMLDTAGHLWEHGKIDGVLLIAPGGVDRNWLSDEIPAHMPDRIREKMDVFLWQTKKAGNKGHAAEFDRLVKGKGFSWLLMNYNSFMTAKGKKAAWRFLRRRRILYILDESDDIKTPKAKRTKSIVASGKWAPYRRIMTGTPADKPFDIYSQLRFLDEAIWRRRGMARFHAFKVHYADWYTAAECYEQTGHDPGYDKLLNYKNLGELADILASVSDRVLKTDVLDLPPKLYTKRYFEMTKKQKGYYDQLREELEIELEDGRIVDGNLAITRLLRLQQITCGYMVTDADEPIELCDNENPRLDATVDFLSRLNHPAIVWARFRHDIDQIMDALGKRAVRYDGRVSDDDCERAKVAFNAGEFDYFVANPAKGARGITLNAAKTVCYYSNSFKLRDRLQSEDRPHRIGQEGVDHGEHGFGVLFCDVLAQGTVDTKIVSNLRGKFNIAAELTGDQLRTWI